jgi:hypothetical protein
LIEQSRSASATGETGLIVGCRARERDEFALNRFGILESALF